MIYQPEEDSFLLVKYVRRLAKGKVLDIGTGSGILAETALEKTNDVLATDINIEAIDYCKNKGINVVFSDLFSNVQEKYDLIIFNPPYLPKDNYGPDLETAGGKNGYELIEKFLSKANLYLKENGKILMVFSSLTGNVNKILRKYRYKFKCLEEKNLFFETLYVYLVKNDR